MVGNLCYELNLVYSTESLMEEYYCNICQKSLESVLLEDHIKEPDHIARKKKLEKELELKNKISKLERSVLDLWKNG
jgi:hypothetical protein